MSAAGPFTYEVPNFENSEIADSIRMGMLGDQVRHITIEQLKSAQPALVLQLCVSILQKLEVDTDHLEQPYLQPELNHPEYYPNTTLLTMHIPKLFHKLVPGCTPKLFCTNDLLRPKWSRIHKFLNVIINYLRYMENTVVTFDEINAKSQETHERVIELDEHNAALKQNIKDIDDYMLKNEQAHKLLQEEVVKVDKELNHLKDNLKEEKQMEKEEVKRTLTEKNQLLESFGAVFQSLVKEIESSKLMVVSSPKRQLSERENLNTKLLEVEDNIAQVKDALTSNQWKVDQEKQVIQRLEYVKKQMSEAQEIVDKIRVLQSDLMNQQFQTESDKMALTRLMQEIDNLKQEINDKRETLHRTKIRLQKQLSTSKQRLKEVVKEKDSLTSQAESKGKQIESLLTSIENEEKDQCKINENFSEKMNALNSVEEELNSALDESHKKMSKAMKTAVSKRISILKKN